MAKKILVAEDEPAISKLVEFKLKKAGYELVCVEDGSKAWETLQKSTPNLIILDVNMPGMTGLEVLSKVRGDERLKALPVLLLTAKGLSEEVAKAAESGTTLHLKKPFDPAELLTTVERMIGH